MEQEKSSAACESVQSCADVQPRGDKTSATVDPVTPVVPCSEGTSNSHVEGELNDFICKEKEVLDNDPTPVIDKVDKDTREPAQASNAPLPDETSSIKSPVIELPIAKVPDNSVTKPSELIDSTSIVSRDKLVSIPNKSSKEANALSILSCYGSGSSDSESDSDDSEVEIIQSSDNTDVPAAPPQTMISVQSWKDRQQSDSDPLELSSDSEDSSEEGSSDSDDEVEVVPQIVQSKSKTSTRSTVTKGELAYYDLPPIEDLHITVPEEECQPLGTVFSIVDILVVVQSLEDRPPLDLDSVLFTKIGLSLGRIFDVFGPVARPFYSLRFNSLEDIKKQNITVGDYVYCAPQSEHTSYIQVYQLMQMKGSDASLKHNNEPPADQIEYSDDEEEMKARRNLNQNRRNRNRGPSQSSENKRQRRNSSSSIDSDRSLYHEHMASIGYRSAQTNRGNGDYSWHSSVPSSPSPRMGPPGSYGPHPNNFNSYNDAYSRSAVAPPMFTPPLPRHDGPPMPPPTQYSMPPPPPVHPFGPYPPPPTLCPPPPSMSGGLQYPAGPSSSHSFGQPPAFPPYSHQAYQHPQYQYPYPHPPPPAWHQNYPQR